MKITVRRKLVPKEEKCFRRIELLISEPTDRKGPRISGSSRAGSSLPLLLFPSPSQEAVQGFHTNPSTPLLTRDFFLDPISEASPERTPLELVLTQSFTQLFFLDLAKLA